MMTAEMAVEQPEIAQLDEQRQDGGRCRKQQPEHQEAHQEPASEEADVGQRKSRHRRQHDRQHHASTGR